MLLALGVLARLFLRVVLILLLAVALVVGVYYGGTAISNAVLLPLEENRQQMDLLQTRQAQSDQDYARQVDELRAIIGTQDALQIAGEQTITDLRAELAGIETDLQTRLDEVENDTTLALSQMETLEGRIDGLDASLESYYRAIDSSQLEMAAIQEKVSLEGQAIDDMRRELQMVRAMELMIRSRLLLGQSNYGLAEQDILAAREMLVGLQPQAPVAQVETLSRVISRLDLVLSGLPDSPAIAAEDVEIAWQMLVRGLSPQVPLSPPTPPAVISVTPMLTATTTLTGTLAAPFLTPTLDISATVTSTITVTGTTTPQNPYPNP